MKKMMMRHLDREVAMQIAFARLLGGEATFDEAIALSYGGTEELEKINTLRTEDDIAFARSLYEGVNEHCSEIDDVIENYLKDWSLKTISKVELTILRIAAYELMFKTDVPQGVVINEAVELAKKYCDDGKHSYINGVLGAYVKDKESGNI